MDTTIIGVPKFSELMNPTLTALKKLGGKADNDEILTQVIADLGLPDEVVTATQPGYSTTKLSYALTWAKSYLKQYGVIENPVPGTWEIRADFLNVDSIDVKNVISSVSAAKRKVEKESSEKDPDVLVTQEPWKEKLLVILRSMNPYDFEALAKEALMKHGLHSVEVTRRSGDRGIDGYGDFPIFKSGSIRIAFQCKRYGETHHVQAPEIRDFRGALDTSYTLGVFITTSTFTKGARVEASAVGKTPIHLVDGSALTQMLAEQEIGLKKHITYSVDEEFFKNYSAQIDEK